MDKTGTEKAELQDHLQVISRLHAQIDTVLGPLVDPDLAAPYALLDFPNHTNVGDSAIYAGEISWLKQKYGRLPQYVNTFTTPPSSDRIPGTGLIFIHGGGNFGDIYPKHQAFREAVMQRYRGRRVIQLPQSIHFGKTAGATTTARAIAENGKVALLVRDTESYDFANQHFDCEVKMCPDMAFAMGPQKRRQPASRDVLLLLRQDEESINPIASKTLPAHWAVEDWLREPADTQSRAGRQARLQNFLSLDVKMLNRAMRLRTYYNVLADIRIERGLRQLSTARYVITDRLHAHILCTLLGIPHSFLDNSYGKIARFSAAFNTLWSGASRADTMTEAVGFAEDYLAHTPPS